MGFPYIAFPWKASVEPGVKTTNQVNIDHLLIDIVFREAHTESKRVVGPEIVQRLICNTFRKPFAALCGVYRIIRTIPHPCAIDQPFRPREEPSEAFHSSVLRNECGTPATLFVVVAVQYRLEKYWLHLIEPSTKCPSRAKAHKQAIHHIRR